MRCLTYFALIAGAMLATPASAAPLDLTPTSRWQVDYSADSCKLARSFGASDDKVILLMERFAPDRGVTVRLIGKPLRGWGWNDGKVRYAFGPGHEPTPASSAFSAELADKTPVLILGLRSSGSNDSDARKAEISGQPNPGSRPDETGVRELVLERGGDDRLRLILGPMDEPLAALDACIDELVTHWGLDPAQQAALTTRPEPVGSPGNWLGWADYPGNLLENNKQAIIAFRLNVGADGQPTSCHIQATTNPPDFGPISCRLLMKRARFKPARDATGAAVPSYYINSVRWVIPD